MVKASEETVLLAEDKENSKSEKIPYPKSIFFIIGNEFCERFSYYGMKTILILFLTKIIRYEDNLATTVYHVFSMGCYFTPVFGAMLADSLLGKFRTIFYVSILYAIGNIVLSLSAIPRFLPTEIIALLGLTLIAIGTGGIKPCVSAFGGDQFAPSQEKQLQRFFSFFYMSINLGSLFSTILTPYLREDVWCFQEKSCFSLAFGVPAILMIVSLILFLLGRPLYKIVAPKGNIVIQVIKAISHAISVRCKEKKEVSTKGQQLDCVSQVEHLKKNHKGQAKRHWLDYANDKYDQQFLDDIKDVLHVLFLYIPLPVFWALFDQQGSRWTLQATAMDGDTLPGLHIKPDQMQVINPALIIIFIPLFEYCIYPLLKKCNLLTRPLQRITVGGILGASSFVVAAFVEMALQRTLPVLPNAGYSHLSVLNILPCNINISTSFSNSSIDILHNEMTMFRNIEINSSQVLNFDANCTELKNSYTSYDLRTNASIEVIMAADINSQLHLLKFEDDLNKPEEGESKVRVFFVPRVQSDSTVLFKLEPVKESSLATEIKFENFTDSEETILISKYQQIFPTQYSLNYDDTNGTEKLLGKIDLKMGANYILTIVPDDDNENYRWNYFVMVQPNSLSMFYQIPQYIIITAAEIMFSITGLEFSYSQAPKSMKAVLQAAWLLTVAFGNLIVVIVAQARMFSKQAYQLEGWYCLYLYLTIDDNVGNNLHIGVAENNSKNYSQNINAFKHLVYEMFHTQGDPTKYYEFFMFAGLMVVDMIIFAIMAYFYKYVERPNAEQELLPTPDKREGVENPSFSDSCTKM